MKMAQIGMRRGEGVDSCIKGRRKNRLPKLTDVGGEGKEQRRREGAVAVMRPGVAWLMKIFRLHVACHN